MGYYKNLEVAGQVEEADRVPPPKPASSHVAYTAQPVAVSSTYLTYFPTRRLTRQIEKATARQERCRLLRRIGWTLIGVTLGISATIFALNVWGW
jgi:hypothetical protein